LAFPKGEAKDVAQTNANCSYAVWTEKPKEDPNDTESRNGAY